MALHFAVDGENAGVDAEKFLETEACYRDDKKERNQIFMLAYYV